MHDPMTVAFDIRWPFKDKSGYRPSIVTIWHVDPERGGSDDSCGWHTPKFTKRQKETLDNLAWHEANYPWFMALDAKQHDDPVQAEILMRGAFLLVSRSMVNRGGLRKGITLDQATEWASLSIHNSVDSFRGSLCFKSGYHSNWYKKDEGIPNTPKEDEYWRKESARNFFGSILGWILRDRRPWYRKPRWHVWHWKLQIHFLQKLKRWAFSRCCKCRKRFPWGYSPVSNQWHGDGPRWFRGERDVFHHDCNRPSSNGCMAAEPVSGA